MLEIPRVLVVDADAEALCDELARFGLDAQGASDANDALTCLRTDSFDLVLVELDLRGLSGIGLLRRLDRMGSRVPFVGMGAAPSEDDFVQLLRGGAIDFLRKPVRATDVEDALERAKRHAAAPPPSDRAADPQPPRSPPPSRPGAHAPTMPTSRGAHTGPPGPESGVPPRQHARSDRDPHEPRHQRPAAASPAEERGFGAVDRAPAPRPAAPPSVPHRHEDPMQDMLIRLRNGEVDLPAIAPIANDIQDLLDRLDSGVDAVVRVVSRDPSVVAGVLRLANSGRYGTSKGITDIRQACLRLGNQRVLALAQQLVVGGMYVLSVEPFGTIVTDLWRNTLACAQGARKLADLLEIPDREALFVGAMLHNVGELALLRVLSELPDRIPPGREGLVQLQGVLAGAHEEFGAAILKRWRMPPRFVRIAGAHHHPPAGLEDRVAKQQRLIAVLSWTMSLREGFVYLPGQEPPDVLPLVDELGLTIDDVNSAFAGCRKWISKDGTLTAA